MSSLDHYKWREVSPGRYERDSDSIETLFSTMEKTWEGIGHSFFAVASCADFKFDNQTDLPPEQVSDQVIASFKHAWKRMRYEFPSFASQVVYNEAEEKVRKRYEVLASPDDVQLWMQETFRVAEDDRTARDYANGDHPVIGLSHVTLCGTDPALRAANPTSTMSVVYRCRHDTVDGVGSLKVLNYLLQFAAQAWDSISKLPPIIFGNEWTRLSPPLELAAQIPQKPTEKQMADFGVTLQRLLKEIGELELIGLPAKKQGSIPLRSQYAAIKLSTEDTSRILKTCKSFGVTATHVFHTAIGTALWQLQESGADERLVRYLGYSLIDLRHLCHESGQPDPHPAAIHHAGSVNQLLLDFKVPAKPDSRRTLPKAELLKHVLNTKDFYMSTTIDDDFLASIPYKFRMITTPYPRTTPPIPELSPWRKVSLSSVGRMENFVQDRHGALAVYEPWSVGTEYTTGLGTYLGTFRGELRYWSAYNEAFFDEKEVLDFLDRVKNVAFDILDAIESGSNNSSDKVRSKL